MKKVFIIFVLFIILFQLHAADNADLTIKAFKSGYDGVRVIINNRTTRDDIFELKNDGTTVTGSRIIELNDVLKELLGFVDDSSVLSTSSSFDSYVIFSYRVEGTVTGSYKLIFNLENLRNQNGGFINASYQLGNFDVVFPSSAASEEPSDNFNSDDSIAILYNSTDVQEGAAVGSTGSTELTSEWKVGTPVYQDEKLSGVTPIEGQSCGTWIARGAVGMTIDNTGYTNASYGEYIADVTVTLVCP